MKVKALAVLGGLSKVKEGEEGIICHVEQKFEERKGNVAKEVF